MLVVLLITYLVSVIFKNLNENSNSYLQWHVIFISVGCCVDANKFSELCMMILTGTKWRIAQNSMVMPFGRALTAVISKQLHTDVSRYQQNFFKLINMLAMKRLHPLF